MAEMNRLAKLLYDNFKRLSQARAEAQHPHPARQRRIEQVIVPVGRLEQRIVRIERDHVEIELVGDALLGELEAALAGLDQRVAERRLEAEQRGQVVDELVFLVVVALRSASRRRPFSSHWLESGVLRTMWRNSCVRVSGSRRMIKKFMRLCSSPPLTE